MTCGIYKLNFKGTDKVYIGQSIFIENRYKAHLRSLRKNSSPIKIQTAYNTFGIPSLEILTECLIEELNTFEAETIEIWNSVDKGFNYLYCAEEIPYCRGEDNGGAIFSNEQIITVLLLLTQDSPPSTFEIRKITGVSAGVINQIACLRAHTWLAETFPLEYNILKELLGTRSSRVKTAELTSAKARGIEYPELMSPIGEIYHVENVNKFARDYKLDCGALCNVLNKKAKSTKGWTLA